MKGPVFLVTLVIVVTACTGPGPDPAAAQAPPEPGTSPGPRQTRPLPATEPSDVTPPMATTETTTRAEPVPRPVPMAEVTVTRNLTVPGGLAMDRFAPRGPGPWPVVVTIHGGSWLSGERKDLEPFARSLARHGLLVYNAGYRPLDQGGAFPAMFQDVACAVAAARADAPSAGGSGHTTVVGFSAGAHLASVVALAPSEFAGACTPPRVDAFAGISGPYDSDQFPFLALQFGGLQRDVPAAWAAGNPYTYIGRNPDLDVLLIHGEDDVVVDPGFSTEFAEALRQAGYGVQLHTVPGAGHFSIIEPDESGGPTAEVVATFVLDRAG